MWQSHTAQYCPEAKGKGLIGRLFPNRVQQGGKWTFTASNPYMNVSWNVWINSKFSKVFSTREGPKIPGETQEYWCCSCFLRPLVGSPYRLYSRNLVLRSCTFYPMEPTNFVSKYWEKNMALAPNTCRSPGIRPWEAHTSDYSHGTNIVLGIIDLDLM